MHNIRTSGRDVKLGALQYLSEQLFVVTPVPLLVAVAGLLYLFFSPGGRRYRVSCLDFYGNDCRHHRNEGKGLLHRIVRSPRENHVRAHEQPIPHVIANHMLLSRGCAAVWN